MAFISISGSLSSLFQRSEAWQNNWKQASWSLLLNLKLLVETAVERKDQKIGKNSRYVRECFSFPRLAHDSWGCGERVGRERHRPRWWPLARVPVLFPMSASARSWPQGCPCPPHPAQVPRDAVWSSMERDESGGQHSIARRRVL